ncbi:hypothetical protein ACFC4S_26585 [Priestia megaterium]|uniref:hypothetical protein n=1 Tax=Priestia megaterium TaxID=1404 RepID=UPI001D76D6BC|nr:hypothetical protein [Priestia megaterium]
MNMFKKGWSKLNLKGIILCLILVFIFISCVILSFPSARYDIVHLLKTGVSDNTSVQDPEIYEKFGTESQRTW